MEYLNLYIGCDVAREHSETRSDKFFEHGKIVGVSASEVETGKTVAIIDVGLDHFHEWYAEETKLALRKLSSMTEEEGYMIENEMRTYSPKFNYPAGCTHFDNVELHEISYLLTVLRKYSFDCDNLIENGLAIEIETINNKQ